MMKCTVPTFLSHEYTLHTLSLIHTKMLNKGFYKSISIK